MKKILTLLLILISFSGYSQTNEHLYRMTTSYAFGEDNYLFFKGDKNEGYIDLLVRDAKETILGPSVFIFTNRGNFAIAISGINKMGYLVCRMHHRDISIMIAIDSGIKSVRYTTRSRTKAIRLNGRLNDEILELKRYTKPL